MTVICEECGKVYHIDPDKLERYRGKSIRVRCGECGHVTQLSNLLESSAEPADAYSDEAVPGIPGDEEWVQQTGQQPVRRFPLPFHESSPFP